jgi:hypothetical protein
VSIENGDVRIFAQVALDGTDRPVACGATSPIEGGDKSVLLQCYGRCQRRSCSADERTRRRSTA